MGGGGWRRVRVRVLWTNEAVRGTDLRGWAAAVVDCLRATSSVAAALAAGARAVVPVATVEEARAYDPAYLRAGEQQTVPIPGFDFGNSPGAFTPAVVGGRSLVLVTTNGSKALRWTADAGADPIVAFALVNVAAAARALAGVERLCVVCAGTRGEFALDDACCAGALLDRLERSVPLTCDDAAKAALLLYRAGGAALVAESRAAANLRAHHYDDDLAWCAREDVLAAVPLWDGKALVRA
jgi:2-phosphosulfolactate phosphatase